MPYEILYTSAPSGLKPGSSGYCTVKSSRGIPAPAVDLLESLSGYRHVFTPGSPEAARNPVNWGHYFLRISGRTEHVLSRVSDCGLDYTGRSNKLAHHMVIDASCPAGPAWLVGQPGWMIGQWDGQLEQFATVRKAPPERRAAGRCAAWEAATGDAGWGGVLAESFLADPERKVFIIYRPDQNILPLIEEAIALLPENRRWEVTFATYGAALPKTVECAWTGVVAGSPEVQQSRRFVNALRIDLTAPMPKAQGARLVAFARTGLRQEPTAPVRRAEPPGFVQPTAAPPAIPLAHRETYAFAAPEEVASEVDDLSPPSLPSRKRSNLSGYLWLSITSFVVAALLAGGLVLWRRGYFQAPALQPEGMSDESTASPPKDQLVATEVTEDTKPPTGEVPNSIVPSDTSAAFKDDRMPASGTQEKPSAPSPVERDPVVDAPAPTRAAPQKRRTVVVTRASHLGGRKATELSLPTGTFGLAEVSSCTLFLPKARGGADHRKSFYEIVMQQTEESTSRIVAAKGQKILQLTVEAKVESGRLIVTVDTPTTLDRPYAECLDFGVIELTDSRSQQEVVLHLQPEHFESVSYPIENASVLIRSPEPIKKFSHLARAEDIFLSDLEVTHQGVPLKVLSTDNNETTCELTVVTEGVFERLRVLKASSVDDDGNIRAEIEFVPKAEEVTSARNELVGSMKMLHEKMKAHFGGQLPPELETLSPAKAGTKPNISDARDVLMQRLDARRKELEKDKNEKELDRIAKEYGKIINDLDTLTNSATQYHRMLAALEAIKSKLALRSGTVSHAVYLLQVDPKFVGPTGPPPVRTEMVPLWKFSSNR